MSKTGDLMGKRIVDLGRQLSDARRDLTSRINEAMALSGERDAALVRLAALGEALFEAAQHAESILDSNSDESLQAILMAKKVVAALALGGPDRKGNSDERRSR